MVINKVVAWSLRGEKKRFLALNKKVTPHVHYLADEFDDDEVIDFGTKIKYSQYLHANEDAIEKETKQRWWTPRGYSELNQERQERRS